MSCQAANAETSNVMPAYEVLAACNADPWNSIFSVRCGHNPTLADDDREEDRSTVADDARSTVSDDDLEEDRSNEAHSDSEDGPEAASKARWADLESEDEDLQVRFAEKLGPVTKPRWADLADDSDDEDQLHRQLMAKAEALEVCLVSNESTEEHVHQNWSHTTASSAYLRKADPDTCFKCGKTGHWARNCAEAEKGKGGGKGGSKDGGKDKGKGKGATPLTDAERANTKWNAGRGSDERSNKTTAKGVGKGGGKSRGRAANSGPKGLGKGAAEKLQCQFIIGIEEDNQFRVMRRIIGQGGEHMKSIAQKTDAKLRLRGRGSKFLEGPDQKESTDDLMLCVSSQDKVGFENAKNLVSELLEGIYKSYSVFCAKAGKSPPALGIQLHEGFREGSR